MEALELFKELDWIGDYEPYICFEDGDWVVCWIKIGEPESETGGDVEISFWDEDLSVAIQQAYKWFKNRG